MKRRPWPQFDVLDRYIRNNVYFPPGDGVELKSTAMVYNCDTLERTLADDDEVQVGLTAITKREYAERIAIRLEEATSDTRRAAREVQVEAQRHVARRKVELRAARLDASLEAAREVVARVSKKRDAMLATYSKAIAPYRAATKRIAALEKEGES